MRNGPFVLGIASIFAPALFAQPSRTPATRTRIDSLGISAVNKHRGACHAFICSTNCCARRIEPGGLRLAYYRARPGTWSTSSGAGAGSDGAHRTTSGGATGGGAGGCRYTGGRGRRLRSYESDVLTGSRGSRRLPRRRHLPTAPHRTCSIRRSHPAWHLASIGMHVETEPRVCRFHQVTDLRAFLETLG